MVELQDGAWCRWIDLEKVNPMSLISRAQFKNEGDKFEKHLDEEMPFEWSFLQKR